MGELVKMIIAKDTTIHIAGFPVKLLQDTVVETNLMNAAMIDHELEDMA